MKSNELVSVRWPVYIINLKRRTDRRKHILEEFEGRSEFEIHIVAACENKKGNIGLWNSIKYLLLSDTIIKKEYIILCEDDHQFTSKYSKKRLSTCIKEAYEKGADVLVGGVSGFTSALRISNQLYWVEKFSGLQFTVIFRKFFHVILDSGFESLDAADYKISVLTDNKFFVHPFISVQKDFGYSDVTFGNRKGHVEDAFQSCITKISLLKDVSEYYTKDNIKNDIKVNPIYYNNVIIPTYLINLPEQTARRLHIESEFKGKSEFKISLLSVYKHKIKTVGLWLSIRKIIKMALKNNEDVIIICKDDHEFTDYYSKEFLIQNIMEAHNQCADYLSGGTTDFEAAIPITKNRFWINQCLSDKFVVLYKKFFKKIIDEPFNHNVKSDLLLSEMTANKMVIYPFISRQKNFSYPDIETVQAKGQGLTSDPFDKSMRRLKVIQDVYFKYNNQGTKVKL